MTDTRIARLARRESNFRRQHSDGSDYRFGDRIIHLMAEAPESRLFSRFMRIALMFQIRKRKRAKTNISPGVKGETHCKTWNVRS
jgi:hypothetical protein